MTTEGTENTEGEFGGLPTVAAHFLGESGRVGDAEAAITLFLNGDESRRGFSGNQLLT